MNPGKVVIFCASSDQIDPAFNQAARAMVRALHQLGYSFVSGGGNRGTMGAIAREADACGAFHTGVLPRFMKGLEYPGLSAIEWTDTISARKERMRRDTVAAIALPGGIGTLDEFAETHTLRKLNQYKGELFVLNVNGFFDPFKALLDHYVATGMLSVQDKDLVHFPESVEELVSYFK